MAKKINPEVRKIAKKIWYRKEVKESLKYVTSIIEIGIEEGLIQIKPLDKTNKS